MKFKHIIPIIIITLVASIALVLVNAKSNDYFSRLREAGSMLLGANSVFNGYQGGTGISTTTSGNVGKALTVASTSPFLTYEFTSISGGAGATSTINGVNGPNFTFATGTTGVDFNIATSSGTVTFNAPTASSTVRGLLSTSDWTNFNNAYSQRLQWDGGSTNLVAATGRTSLELGSMALEANTGSTTITTIGTLPSLTVTGTTTTGNATTTNLTVASLLQVISTTVTSLFQKISVALSLIIPNSASLVTDTTGQIGIDTTSGQFRYNDGTATRTMTYIKDKSFTLGSPAVGDNALIFKAPYDITLTGVDCLSDNASSTSVSAGIDIFKGDANGVATSTLLTGGTLTCLSTANTATTTTNTITSGNWVGFVVKTASGTPTWLQTTIKYAPTAD